MVNVLRKVGCPLHNKAREKRFAREGGKFRKGEVDLTIFWSKANEYFVHKTGDESTENVNIDVNIDVNTKPKVENEAKYKIPRKGRRGDEKNVAS